MQPKFGARAAATVAAFPSGAALAVMCAMLVPSGAVSAQAVPRLPPRTQPERPPLGDNSFLVEEAYNQDKGVVQHIGMFVRQGGGEAWTFAFTQEWPVGGQRHQLSYSISESHLSPGASGWGDLILNYRNQVLADVDGGYFFAPRISMSLPTGNTAQGLGSGVVGLQGALPFSLRIAGTLVTHMNAGYAFFPGARDAAGARGTSGTLSLGQSLVWLARTRFNVLLEAAWTGSTRTGGDAKSWESSLFVNPGVRWGYDFHSGLQIVPGISFPIGVGQSGGERQVLLYLSFEHPFTHDW